MAWLMTSFVNTIAFIDAIGLYLIAYRISWATDLYARLSPENVRLKRQTLSAYYVAVVSSFLSLALLATHLTMRSILDMFPSSTLYIGLFSGIFLIEAVYILLRFGRLGRGRLLDPDP